MVIKTLFLDDDVVYLNILKDHMDEYGVPDCYYYNTPGNLLRSVVPEDYLFVIDFNMPGMDGLEVADRILAVNPHALIIILSIQSEMGVVINAFNNHGIWKYHDKNRHEAAILDLINDINFAKTLLENTIRKQEAVAWLKKQARY